MRVTGGFISRVDGKGFLSLDGIRDLSLTNFPLTRRASDLPPKRAV